MARNGGMGSVEKTLCSPFRISRLLFPVLTTAPLHASSRHSLDQERWLSTGAPAPRRPYCRSSHEEDET